MDGLAKTIKILQENNLEKEIEDLRAKHENDMRLSDRMTREIGSLRTMSEEAETKAVDAERKLKLEKPDTVNALESYDCLLYTSPSPRDV